MDLTLLVLSIVSLLAKRELPSLEPTGWAALLLALVLGLVAGDQLARRVDGSSLMRSVMVIAMTGGILALARGVLAIL